MTSAEQQVARTFNALADIPVSQQDVELAHDELRARLRDLPAPAARRSRTRLLVAAAVVALVVAAAAVWAASVPPHSIEPTHRPSHAGDAAAILAATGFVDGFAFFDLPEARDWLAPGARISGDMDAQDWAGLNRYFEETGGQITPEPCRVLTRTAAETRLRCPFRYQLLRSAELGLGPYDGSYFEITTQQGQVTDTNLSFQYQNGFNAQVWSPFAAWMNAVHPKDAAAMYPDWPEESEWGLTDDAIRLWSERTRDFVTYARQMCSTPAGDFAAVCTGARHGR